MFLFWGLLVYFGYRNDVKKTHRELLAGSNLSWLASKHIHYERTGHHGKT